MSIWWAKVFFSFSIFVSSFTIGLWSQNFLNKKFYVSIETFIFFTKLFVFTICVLLNNIVLVNYFVWSIFPYFRLTIHGIIISNQQLLIINSYSKSFGTRSFDRITFFRNFQFRKTDWTIYKLKTCPFVRSFKKIYLFVCSKPNLTLPSLT